MCNEPRERIMIIEIRKGTMVEFCKPDWCDSSVVISALEDFVEGSGVV